jgi:hypothetical protein
MREEQALVEGLMHALRSLLKRPEMTAQQVYYTSLMLRALERMPFVTQGIGMTLSLINRSPSGNTGYQDLTIDDESIRFTTWEYLYNPDIGGDSQDLDNYEIGVGWRHVSADLTELEDWVAWLQRRAENPDIEVSFEDFADSAIDWYDETDGSALWDTLDSNYT